MGAWLAGVRAAAGCGAPRAGHSGPEHAGSRAGVDPSSPLPPAPCCAPPAQVLEQLDATKFPLPEPYPYKEAAAFFKQPEVTPADQLSGIKWAAPDLEGLVAFLCGAPGLDGAGGGGGVRHSAPAALSRRLPRRWQAPGAEPWRQKPAPLVARAPLPGVLAAARTIIVRPHACTQCALPGEKGFAEDRVRKAVERINAAKHKASQGRLESFFGPVKVRRGGGGGRVCTHAHCGRVGMLRGRRERRVGGACLGCGPAHLLVAPLCVPPWTAAHPAAECWPHALAPCAPAGHPQRQQGGLGGGRGGAGGGGGRGMGVQPQQATTVVPRLADAQQARLCRVWRRTSFLSPCRTPASFMSAAPGAAHPLPLPAGPGPPRRPQRRQRRARLQRRRRRRAAPPSRGL